jgi:hypothetical protein
VKTTARQVAVKIGENQDASKPIKMNAQIAITPAAVPGQAPDTISKTEDLLPIDIVANKKGESPPSDDRLLVKVGDTVELTLSGSGGYPAIPNVRWEMRQLKSDGTFHPWDHVGNDSECEILPVFTGVFQLRALINGKEYRYLRHTTDPHSELKAGDPNALGVYVITPQKVVLDEAVKELGNPAYAVAASLSNDPLGLFSGKNKCNVFVADVLEKTAYEIDPPLGGTYFGSPPSANNWAGIRETGDPATPRAIAGWILTGDDPCPGYVVGRGNETSAPGHCGIVDYDGRWISAGSPVNRKASFEKYQSMTSTGSKFPAGQHRR